MRTFAISHASRASSSARTSSGGREPDHARRRVFRHDADNLSAQTYRASHSLKVKRVGEVAVVQDRLLSRVGACQPYLALGQRLLHGNAESGRERVPRGSTGSRRGNVFSSYLEWTHLHIVADRARARSGVSHSNLEGRSDARGVRLHSRSA